MIPKTKGGSDEFDNVLLLCGSCHAKIHGRSFDPNRPNCKTSVDYETAKTVLPSCSATEMSVARVPVAQSQRTIKTLSIESHPQPSSLLVVLISSYQASFTNFFVTITFELMKTIE